MENLPVEVHITPLPVSSVVSQVKAIHDLMKSGMKDGHDYGLIPGTDKPTLLKPGAEKIAFYFRLSARYTVQTEDLPGGHKNIKVQTTLYSLTTQQIIGEGVGSCSTLESKYRYRYEDIGPVPKEYWTNRDPAALPEAGAIVKKKGNEWRVLRRVEAEPADFYNTVLKMAKKRSYVDAIITSTAASELFTQDVEEETEVPKQAPKPAPDDYKKQVWAALKKAGFSQDEAKAFWASMGSIDADELLANLDTAIKLWKEKKNEVD